MKFIKEYVKLKTKGLNWYNFYENIFLISSVLIFVILFGIYYFTGINIIEKAHSYVVNWIEITPEENPIRIIITSIIIIFFGIVGSGILTFFSYMYSLIFMVFISAIIGKKTDKTFELLVPLVGFVVLVSLSIWLFFVAIRNSNWPYTDFSLFYYKALKNVCIFISSFSIPVFILIRWLKMNSKYFTKK